MLQPQRTSLFYITMQFWGRWDILVIKVTNNKDNNFYKFSKMLNCPLKSLHQQSST